MSNATKINVGGTSYDIADKLARENSVYFVVGTQTKSTNVWTGELPDGITEYYEGLEINYFLPYAGTSSAATLNLGGLGAKPVYRQGANSVTNHFGVYSVVHLTYVIRSGLNSGNGAWEASAYYDSSNYYRMLDYYFRPYAGSALYRYKFCMLDADNRLQPIVTTNQSSATQVAKAINPKPVRPDNIWYYNSTTTVSAGAVVTDATLYSQYGDATIAAYNFNNTIPVYSMVYLRGTYDKATGLFTLYDDGESATTSYYTVVPTNTASIKLSDYFVSGYYYIKCCASYSTANYITLFANNPMFYFDGTNLIPVEMETATATKNGLMSSTDKSKLDGIASNATAVTESTVSGWGFTKNTGTYSKPSTGIPKTDLASAVQTSLSRADTALQSAPVTSVNSKTGAVSLTYSDVGAAASSHTHAYIPTSQKGAAGGVAELDTNGKVPSTQLPSYVDDVIEGYYYNSKFWKESAHTTEIVGETGKIYIDLATNKTYRWSGSAFAVISDTLALGETSSTAYRGDRGKIAYDHSQSAHARTDATKVSKSTTNGNILVNDSEVVVYTHPSGTNPHGTTKSDVGLGNVGNFKAVSTVALQGLSDTEKANARANIGAGTSSFSGSYNDLTNKPTIPTVNNATLTIQKNGTAVKTFTANASSDVTANITVPTKVSELSNDSGYTTNVGTITGIKMNGASKGSSGVVDLGTVLTSHQDVSGKENTSNKVTSWSSTTTDTHYPSEKLVKTSLDGKAASSHTHTKSQITDFPTLATVATSGSYNDLSNKPTIPSAVTESTVSGWGFTKNTGTVTSVEVKMNGATKGTISTSGTIDLGTVLTAHQDISGKADNIQGLYYGTCATAAATKAKVVSLTNGAGFSLTTGAIVAVKFTYASAASTMTMNVAGSGAKKIVQYGTTAASSGTTTSGWIAGAVVIFIYDGTSWVRSYFYNTTYAAYSFGIGYGTCATAEATVAKVVTFANYTLATNGICAVKFTYGVPASATMNINSKGAKAIFYKGSAIASGIIKAGDVATFIYDGTQYQLLAVDRVQDSYTKAEIDSLIGDVESLLAAI